MFDMPLTVGQVRAERLACFLETLPIEDFDINIPHRVTACGTTACIAGWAVIQGMNGGEIQRQPALGANGYRWYDHVEGRRLGISEMAQDYLGLDDATMKVLFYPRTEEREEGEPYVILRHHPSPQAAAAALRRAMVGQEIWPRD